MVDTIRRRQIDESLNDIKNFNSVVFDLERKNADLQAENVLPHTQINPEAIAATKTSVQELYLVIEKKRAAITNAGHTPVHRSDIAEAGAFEEVRQRYNGIAQQILTDINAQPAQTSHQRIASLKSILALTSQLPNKYLHAVVTMLATSDLQAVVTYMPRLIEAMVFYQIINAQLPGTHLAEIEHSDITRGVTAFLNSRPDIKQIYDENRIPTDDFNVGSSGNFPPRPPPPPPSPPGGFPPGGAPPDGYGGYDGGFPPAPQSFGANPRPRAGTGSAATEPNPADQEEATPQGMVAMPSQAPQAEQRGLLERMGVPRLLPVGFWGAPRPEPEQFNIGTVRDIPEEAEQQQESEEDDESEEEDEEEEDEEEEGEAPTDPIATQQEAYPQLIQDEIDEGEQENQNMIIQKLAEAQELAKGASSVMANQVLKTGSFVVRHVERAVEEATSAGSDVIVVVAKKTREGGQLALQIPLEVAKFVAKHPDAVAGAMMTFFWTDTLMQWLPSVPDLVTDPIAMNQNTLTALQNPGWMQSIWHAVNPYAQERHMYMTASQTVNLMELTQQLSPQVRHAINVFFPNGGSHGRRGSGRRAKHGVSPLRHLADDATGQYPQIPGRNKRSGRAGQRGNDRHGSAYSNAGDRIQRRCFNGIYRCRDRRHGSACHRRDDGEKHNEQTGKAGC